MPITESVQVPLLLVVSSCCISFQCHLSVYLDVQLPVAPIDANLAATGGSSTSGHERVSLDLWQSVSSTPSVPVGQAGQAWPQGGPADTCFMKV